ncbi:hypothetical protein L9F63_013889, partial [Diploptera punctata]
MGKIAAIVSFVCLFAVGANAWAHGSVASCPEGPEPECPFVESGIHDNMYPHPTDCHYFVHCDAGNLPICKECPADLHFNNVTKLCDYPASAGCESVPAPVPTTVAPPAPSTTLAPWPSTETTTLASITTTPGSSDCHKEPECPVCSCDGDRLEHEDECKWYFECEDGKYHLKDCPDGMYYDSDKK